MGKFSQIIFRSTSENPEEMHQNYFFFGILCSLRATISEIKYFKPKQTRNTKNAFNDVKSRVGTKPIPSTRSIGYRVNFKVSVSPKNPIPIPSTFRYYFDTFSILYKYRFLTLSCNEIIKKTQ